MSDPLVAEADVRRAALSAAIESEGRVDVHASAERFGVHTMTIRRDLRVLEQSGKLRRIRGGAVFATPDVFAGRMHRAAQAKTVIGEKLHQFVPASGAICLDSSSTVHRLAVNLPMDSQLLVVTNGFETFQALQGRESLRVCLTGGELDSQTGSLVGSVAARLLSQFRFEVAFLSAAAVVSPFAPSEPTSEEAVLKHAMAASSARTVVAVDSSKLCAHAGFRSLTADQVSVLVTELDPRDKALDPFRDLVEIV